jgi:hypothetical protein
MLSLCFMEYDLLKLVSCNGHISSKSSFNGVWWKKPTRGTIQNKHFSSTNIIILQLGGNNCFQCVYRKIAAQRIWSFPVLTTNNFFFVSTNYSQFYVGLFNKPNVNSQIFVCQCITFFVFCGRWLPFIIVLSFTSITVPSLFSTSFCILSMPQIFPSLHQPFYATPVNILSNFVTLI